MPLAPGNSAESITLHATESPKKPTLGAQVGRQPFDGISHITNETTGIIESATAKDNEVEMILLTVKTNDGDVPQRFPDPTNVQDMRTSSARTSMHRHSASLLRPHSAAAVTFNNQSLGYAITLQPHPSVQRRRRSDPLGTSDDPAHLDRMPRPPSRKRLSESNPQLRPARMNSFALRVQEKLLSIALVSDNPDLELPAPRPIHSPILSPLLPSVHPTNAHARRRPDADYLKDPASDESQSDGPITSILAALRCPQDPFPSPSLSLEPSTTTGSLSHTVPVYPGEHSTSLSGVAQISAPLTCFDTLPGQELDRREVVSDELCPEDPCERVMFPPEIATSSGIARELTGNQSTTRSRGPSAETTKEPLSELYAKGTPTEGLSTQEATSAIRASMPTRKEAPLANKGSTLQTLTTPEIPSRSNFGKTPTTPELSPRPTQQVQPLWIARPANTNTSNAHAGRPSVRGGGPSVKDRIAALQACSTARK